MKFKEFEPRFKSVKIKFGHWSKMIQICGIRKNCNPLNKTPNMFVIKGYHYALQNLEIKQTEIQMTQIVFS